MCATIAAMAVQITKTQIATAMAAEISDIVSSFTLMILLLITFRGRIPGSARPYQHADAQDHRQHPGGQRPFRQVGLQPWRLADSHGRAPPEPSATALAWA
jgi:hypothetical protein